MSGNVTKRDGGVSGQPPKAARRKGTAPPSVQLDVRTGMRPSPGTITASKVPAFLQRLATLTREGLEQEWVRRFRVPVPAIKSRDVLRRIIAWRVQAYTFGGYDRETRRRLKQLIADHANAKPLVTRAAARLSPGTVLKREWKGKVHAVAVEASGFVYEGNSYASLSEIARLITGTRWSGPRLFGIETGRPAAQRDAI